MTCSAVFLVSFPMSLTNSRGSRVAGPKSRSRVQCRGREKSLDFDLTEWKRKNYKGKKNRFYARYSTVANFPEWESQKNFDDHYSFSQN